MTIDQTLEEERRAAAGACFRGSRIALIYDATAEGTDTYIIGAASEDFTRAQGGHILTRRARGVTVDFRYNGHASSATGQPAIIAEGHIGLDDPEEDPPDADDGWGPLELYDGLITPTALVGSLPTGTAWTKTPVPGVMGQRAAAWIPPASTGTADKMRKKFVFDVQAVRWVRVSYAEVGDTTNRGTFLAKAMLFG